jgi:pyruvate, water dikinase
MSSTGLLACPLGAVGAGHRAEVGGKGASLGELQRAGLPVPPGFVVTVAAFERALAAIDPGQSIASRLAALDGDDITAIERATAAIRAWVTAAPFPPEVADAINASYAALGDEMAVAVRSSAVGEDSAEASFAGLQDTYLWVHGAAAVLDNVRRCWASLYNAEAVSYRLQHGLAGQHAAMAVVVQEMVDPRSAGVMFTCSPTTGDRSVVAIEGSWGLGSVLVSGEVTPDSFVVNKITGEIVRRSIATKLRLNRRATSGEGTTADDVPEHLRTRPCLEDDEIRALARLGLQVERHYGTAQDVEWAATRDQIVLLQSRAETVWTPRTAAPQATPKRRPMDHVFEQLSHVVRVTER